MEFVFSMTENKVGHCFNNMKSIWETNIQLGKNWETKNIYFGIRTAKKAAAWLPCYKQLTVKLQPPYYELIRRKESFQRVAAIKKAWKCAPPQANLSDDEINTRRT